LLLNIYHKIKVSSFAKNALILTAGTVIAQALPFLFYPILGRIYTPLQFGLLATILAIIPFCTIIATGAYENAILVADTEQEAAAVIMMIIRRSLIVCVLLGVGFYLFTKPLIDLLHEPLLKEWIIIPSFAAFATVIYICFNEWSVRKKYFVGLSVNKIINTSSIAISKLLAGIFSLTSNGLVFGDIFGKALTAVVCFYRIIRLDGHLFFKVKVSEFKSLAKKYNDMPRYMISDQILNNVGGSIHILFITAYFSTTELGYVSMAASLLTVPVTVVSAAIKDVFRQKANEEYSQTGTCRKTFVSLLIPITISSLLLSIPFYFLLPQGITFFLGNQWFKTGDYGQILLPMYISNFISMSLGGVLIIANKMAISLLWQMYTIVVSVISFFVGVKFNYGLDKVLYLFMIARTSAYLLYIFLSYYYSKSYSLVKK
jgi:O-antigen/teichoic acid export membrane protein